MPVSPPPFLAVDAVEKQFVRVHAVAGISLRVQPGEIFALLGPNGAGKSTLLRMLVGITRPDRGTITWDLGNGPRPTLQPQEAGYLPEDRGLYQDAALRDVMRYFGELRGMSRTDATRAAATWLDRLELGPRATDKLGTLSKGNQQKVQFAAAVLHRPRFAILDEPFSGLDPLNQELFLALIRELRDDGTTVMFSAHQMLLVERLADRILVMKQGNEVLHGTLAEIRERWGRGERLVLKVSGPPDLVPVRTHAAVAAVDQPAPDEVAITLVRGHHVGDLLGTCARAMHIVAVRTEQPSLHDVYIDTVGGTDTREVA